MQYMGVGLREIPGLGMLACETEENPLLRDPLVVLRDPLVFFLRAKMRKRDVGLEEKAEKISLREWERHGCEEGVIGSAVLKDEGLVEAAMRVLEVNSLWRGLLISMSRNNVVSFSVCVCSRLFVFFSLPWRKSERAQRGFST